MPNKINLLDLFSGIGGFHKGLEQAGFEIGWNGFSDIDKYANAVYQYQNKDAISLGSVTNIRGKDLPKIDAITFGSPCQDFSIAGSRSGLEGDRSSLISEAIRLIDECRPRFFIWENVKGTFSSNNGEDFWAIIQAFANIGNYRLEWQLLNTRWFLPQNRERIYLVGCLGKGSGQQIFPISEVVKTFVEQGRGYKFVDVYNKKYRNLSPTLSDPCHNNIRLQVKSTEKIIVCKKLNENQQKKLDELKVDPTISGTLTEAIGRGGSSSEYISMLKKNQINTGSIRKLTPVECERLQGFPCGYTEIPYNNRPHTPDGHRYKALGNSMAVPVIRWLGERINGIDARSKVRYVGSANASRQKFATTMGTNLGEKKYGTST